MSDGIAMIRAVGALLTVLGILAGALWAVRRYNLVLPGTGLSRPDRRLAVVERLSLDPRRSLALLRRDNVEHLVLLAPEGHLLVETRTVGKAPAAAADPPIKADAQNAVPASTLVRSAGESFVNLVELARRPFSAAPQEGNYDSSSGVGRKRTGPRG